MRTSLNLFLFFFISFVSVSASGQDVKEDLKKINEVYKNQNYSMDMTYQVYRNFTGKEPVQTELGSMVKKDDKMYMKIGEAEIIRNPEFSLIVDHEMELISLLPAEKTYGNKEMMGVDLETALSYCEKVEQHKGKLQSTYTLGLSEYSEFETAKVTYNSKTFFIEKLELYYRNPVNLEGDENGVKERPRLVITYKNISTQAETNSSTFSYSNFLRKENNRFFCLDKYKKYQFINQLENN